VVWPGSAKLYGLTSLSVLYGLTSLSVGTGLYSRCTAGLHGRYSRCTAVYVGVRQVCRWLQEPSCSHRLSQPWRGHLPAPDSVMRLREHCLAGKCQPERWRRIYHRLNRFFLVASAGLRLARPGQMLLAQAHHNILCQNEAPPPRQPTDCPPLEDSPARPGPVTLV